MHPDVDPRPASRSASPVERVRAGRRGAGRAGRVPRRARLRRRAQRPARDRRRWRTRPAMPVWSTRPGARTSACHPDLPAQRAPDGRRRHGRLGAQDARRPSPRPMLFGPRASGSTRCGSTARSRRSTPPARARRSRLDRPLPADPGADRGAELLGRTIALAARSARAWPGWTGLVVLDAGLAERNAAVAGRRPGQARRLAGRHRRRRLRGRARPAARRGLRLEMADRETLVPLLSIGDDERSIERVASTGSLASLERRRGAPRPPLSSAVWRVRPGDRDGPARGVLRAARAGQRRRSAVGPHRAETAAPYPPGIPALAPGRGRVRGDARGPAGRGRRGQPCGVLRRTPRWTPCWSSSTRAPTRARDRRDRPCVASGWANVQLPDPAEPG